MTVVTRLILKAPPVSMALRTEPLQVEQLLGAFIYTRASRPQHLLSPGKHAQCFSSRVSISSHNNTVRQVLLLAPFSREETEA